MCILFDCLFHTRLISHVLIGFYSKNLAPGLVGTAVLSLSIDYWMENNEQCNSLTVGIRNPDLTRFWMVNYVRILNGFPILNSQGKFFCRCLHSKTGHQKRPDFEWIRFPNGRIWDPYCTWQNNKQEQIKLKLQ